MKPQDIRKILDQAVEAHRSGDIDRAMPLYEKVVNFEPLNANALSNIALIYKARKDIDLSAVYLQKSALIKPDLAAAYNNLGNLLRENGHRTKAPNQNRRCVILSPLYAEGFNNLGMSLPDQESGQRLHAYRKCLVIRPDYAEGWLNLGNLAALDRTTPTDPIPENFYRKSLVVRPTYSVGISSYGVYLASVGELSAAIEKQELALRLDPGYEEAYFNLALYYLLSGRFHEGFKLYETGIGGRSADNKRGNRRRLAQPRWNGEDLAGKSILVTAEQGIGDEIMFSSLIPELKERAERIYLECTPRLVPIMRRSFPDVGVFMYNPKNPSALLSDRGIDYSVPVGSLPLYFRKCVYEFGRQRPYLAPNPSLARHFRAKYREMFPGKTLIGYSWRGGSGQLRSQSRSLNQKTFSTLFESLPVQGISLQYGIKSEEAAWFNQNRDRNVFWDDTVEPLDNMDIALAQIAAMDLVVSVTNAAVHCAGAMGIPCWILVPHISDWRWTWGRDDVIWYPGMRSFRQESVGDWTEALSRVRKALIAICDGRGTLRATPAPDMDWRGDL